MSEHKSFTRQQYKLLFLYRGETTFAKETMQAPQKSIEMLVYTPSSRSFGLAQFLVYYRKAVSLLLGNVRMDRKEKNFLTQQ